MLKRPRSRLFMASAVCLVSLLFILAVLQIGQGTPEAGSAIMVGILAMALSILVIIFGAVRGIRHPRREAEKDSKKA